MSLVESLPILGVFHLRTFSDREISFQNDKLDLTKRVYCTKVMSYCSCSDIARENCPHYIVQDPCGSTGD